MANTPKSLEERVMIWNEYTPDQKLKAVNGLLKLILDQASQATASGDAEAVECLGLISKMGQALGLTILHNAPSEIMERGYRVINKMVDDWNSIMGVRKLTCGEDVPGDEMGTPINKIPL